MRGQFVLSMLKNFKMRTFIGTALTAITMRSLTVGSHPVTLLDLEGILLVDKFDWSRNEHYVFSRNGETIFLDIQENGSLMFIKKVCGIDLKGEIEFPRLLP